MDLGEIKGKNIARARSDLFFDRAVGGERRKNTHTERLQ